MGERKQCGFIRQDVAHPTARSAGAGLSLSLSLRLRLSLSFLRDCLSRNIQVLDFFQTSKAVACAPLADLASISNIFQISHLPAVSVRLLTRFHDDGVVLEGKHVDLVCWAVMGTGTASYCRLWKNISRFNKTLESGDAPRARACEHGDGMLRLPLPSSRTPTRGLGKDFRCSSGSASLGGHPSDEVSRFVQQLRNCKQNRNPLTSPSEASNLTAQLQALSNKHCIWQGPEHAAVLFGVSSWGPMTRSS